MKLEFVSQFVSLVVAGWLGLQSAENLRAQDWPQFRGPHGGGVLEKLEHPLEWANDKSTAWSIELPGGGLSSQIVQGDRVFLTTAIGAGSPVSLSSSFAFLWRAAARRSFGLAWVVKNLGL